MAQKSHSQKIVERVFYIIGGVVIAVILPEKLEDFLSLNENILKVAIIITLFIAVYLFIDVYKRIEQTSNKLETSVEYIEESYRSEKGVTYHGKPFKKIIEWINTAENQILILTGPTAIDGKVPPTYKDEARITYLKTIENTVKKNIAKPFKYVRIQQLTKTQQLLPIKSFLPDSTIEHYRNILKMEQRQPSSNPCDFGIMKIQTRSATNFMIIDNNKISIEYDEIDLEGTPMMVGFFFIEDRQGKIVNHFLRYFSNLERHAQTCKLEDLEIK